MGGVEDFAKTQRDRLTVFVPKDEEESTTISDFANSNAAQTHAAIMSLLDAAGVVTGDIWCSGAFSFESPLKDLLDSGAYTLEQLLAEDELLQELRGIHPQLIEFFSTDQAVTGLVKYVILLPNGTPPAPTTTDGGGSGGGGSPSILASSSMVSESLNDSDDEKVKDEAKGDDDTQEKATSAKSESPENGSNEQQPPQQQQKEDHGQELDDSQDQKDTVFVRYPYMACEVICCEIKGIVDRLVDGYVPDSSETSSEDKKEEENAGTPEGKDESSGTENQVTQTDNRRSILDLLFSMLYDSKAGEVDDYRAGYFDKILSVLFRKRPQALARYINEGGGRGQVELMKAMFKHLYSHSIMQIVQRLLLPQPPLPPRDVDDDDDEDKEGQEIFSDQMDGADMDGFGSFRCNWSESEEALKLLLECLIDKSPYPEIDHDEERQLSLYQNASEVLITIIQNSPLTSPTLHTLTTNPILERLIQAATTIEEGGTFSPHDSRQTCTMNVLESLILQLGGYGSVGTMMYPEDEDDEEGGEDGENGEAKNGTGSEDGNASKQFRSTRQEFATSDTLISHLPSMLSNLCHLLQYPEAEGWTSPVQFSRTEPQKILGSSRLRIVRLLESLVLLGDPNVDSQLCGSKCLEICLDLFWKFQWCSMLHQSVANLLVHVFEGANTRAELQSYFLHNCNLLGRLMDSFWEGADNLPDAVMEESQTEPPPSSVDGEIGSIDEDAAAAEVSDDEEVAPGEGEEKEVQNMDSPLGSKNSEHVPPQSFRLGYMGHVIIICQALVHACSNPADDPSVGGTNSTEMNGELGDFVERENEANNGAEGEEGGELQQELDRGQAADSVITDETPANPLILAQLVESHSLRKQWEEFVQTTLAQETAIQSTPLGGFPGQGGPGADPLHLHRPGLAEDDDYDDEDGAAPPLPPRGLLVGGDVIDMDDNDLDVAASMMAGLSMGRSAEGAGRNDQDLLAGIPQQSGDGARGYMFDDPLGDGRFGRFDGDDDDDSSDEESELSGNTGDSGGAVVEGVSGSADHTPEAPVMDLFAGNFEAFDGAEQEGANQQGGDWSDFANFDNAFEGANGPPPDSEDPFNAGPTNVNVDEIFGDVKDHAELLEVDVDPAADAFAAKVSSSEDGDSSSDEEDPVPEQAGTPEAS